MDMNRQWISKGRIGLSLVFTTVLSTLGVWGQPAALTDSLLSLEACINMALERNHSMVMASNTLKMAENNVTAAPFCLPWM